jgi:hypothetical protein
MCVCGHLRDKMCKCQPTSAQECDKGNSKWPSEQFYGHGIASLQNDQLAHGLIGNEVLNALDF